MAEVVRFAAVGDIHGQWLDAAVELEAAADRHGTLDFAVAVGDSEPNRDAFDAAGVAGPAKYRKVGDFPAVADGSLLLPCPVVFVGGNHDPYPSLDELGAGESWAPGVRYLGRAGVTELAGLRLAFLSGIFSSRYSPGRAQDRRSDKSLGYYVAAELDLLLRAGRVDVLVTHDWPAGLGTGRDGTPAGDANLLRVLERLRPDVHVCGHMHHRRAGRVGSSLVVGLDHISGGRSAVATFERRPGGRVVALDDDIVC